MINRDFDKELVLLLSLGAIALTTTPYIKKLTDKFGISKETFLFLKQHYKSNHKQAFDELATYLAQKK